MTELKKLTSPLGAVSKEYRDFLTLMAKAAGCDGKPWKKITISVAHHDIPRIEVEMLGNQEDISAATRHATEREMV